MTEKERAWRRKSHAKKRLRILNQYGGKCKCCGEKEPAFLCFDHVNGDGAKQRKELLKNYGNWQSSGIRYIMKWAEENNFPDSLQVLCHNCNRGKGKGKVCPHIKALQECFNVTKILT